jgi:hypothetical protein
VFSRSSFDATTKEMISCELRSPYEPRFSGCYYFWSRIRVRKGLALLLGLRLGLGLGLELRFWLILKYKKSKNRNNVTPKT